MTPELFIGMVVGAVIATIAFGTLGLFLFAGSRRRKGRW